MHEFSMVSAIVENVLGMAEQHKARKVIEVRLAIGKLTHLELEQIRFCYQAITKDTALDCSTLEIKYVEAEVKCSHCSYRGAAKYWEGAFNAVEVPTLQCPSCGAAAEPVKGNECVIKSVKLVT
jgi:hydrogenase nickel incorporation protein HypA/HybF